MRTITGFIPDDSYKKHETPIYANGLRWFVFSRKIKNWTNYKIIVDGTYPVNVLTKGNYRISYIPDTDTVCQNYDAVVLLDHPEDELTECIMKYIGTSKSIEILREEFKAHRLSRDGVK